jgi:MFS family permease
VVNAVINEFAPDGERGRYISVYQMTFSVVDIIAPVTLAAALAHGAFVTWVPLMVVAALDALVLVALAPYLRVLVLRVGHAHSAEPMTRAVEADGL